MVEISTSLLSVKKENVIKTIYNLETAGTDYFHIDVMDGKFVENDTNNLMLEYCEYLENITNVPMEIHLMVEDIESYIDSYIIFNPNTIIFHYEAVKDREELFKLINKVKDHNCKVGVSIKPNTKVEEIYDILPYIHTVLVMTVEPGKGGQKLISETIDKIVKLKQYIDEKKIETEIEADGGINLENIQTVKEAGCDIVVAGTSIISTDDYKKVIKNMKSDIDN